MDRIGLYLVEKHPIRQTIQFSQLAEKRGFECVWQGEEYMPFRHPRDALTPITAIATVTDRIKVGTGVLHTWSRNAVLLALVFATLDELSNGRSMLGIGALWDPMAYKMGIRREKPLKAMREYVTVLKKIFKGENVNFVGEFAVARDIKLEKPVKVPVYVGATGFQMMELAGEIADGVLLNYLVSTEYNKRAVEHLEKGAKKAGRRLSEIDTPQLVACSMDEDADRALDRARLMVIEYLALEPHIMKVSGVKPDLLDEIHKTLGGWPASPDRLKKGLELVDDKVVQFITAAGTAEDCRKKIREYSQTGSTCPLICPVGDNVVDMIEAFAQGYK